MRVAVPFDGTDGGGLTAMRTGGVSIALGEPAEVGIPFRTEAEIAATASFP